MVKALGCGSSIRGFDSRRSPYIKAYSVSKKTFKCFAIAIASSSILFKALVAQFLLMGSRGYQIKHRRICRVGLRPSFILIFIDLICENAKVNFISRFLPGKPFR